MAKTTKSKSPKSARRREDLRRNLPKPSAGWAAYLRRPDFVTVSLILFAFMVVSSSLVIWSREQTKVRVGQVMTDTRLNRLDYAVKDDEATERLREEAGQSAPRVYRPNTAYLNDLDAAVRGLPRAVAGTTSTSEISDEIVKSFLLTDQGLARIQSFAGEDGPTQAWMRWTDQLIRQLRHNPILDSQEYQVFSITPTNNRAFIGVNNTLETFIGDPIELPAEDAVVDATLTDKVMNAGFGPNIAPFIVSRITSGAQTTMRFDAEETQRIAEERAAAVEDVMIEHTRGEVLYAPGHVLTIDDLQAITDEARQYQAAAGVREVWMPRLGILGVCAILTGFFGLFIVTGYPRVVNNAVRASALCALAAGLLGITVLVSAEAPNLMDAAIIAPTLFLAVVVLLAYDQRLAVFLSGVQSVMVALSMEQGTSWFVMLMFGCGIMISMLREVRHRGSLIRAASVTAGILAAAAIMIGLFRVPFDQAPDIAIKQILLSALWAIVASFGVGFVVLGILPGIERLFDITTGMTLAELRDPKEPLLRQLQQKAPGTYNHSLQVANICEAAAEAIGADSLLMYVGAMYHDIGKMNKPQYFVENQAPGDNKHEKLSPAMSLLVIIGHVKDGIELAREYGLPRKLQHFIESHHGTTLVEYFYHAAKSKAEQDEKATVNEVEYRYPGPKPSTREAAILMLADAVESASRAMTEPNPSRIEGLVNEIASKRLMDGQFDECGLTFRELGLIKDAIISRVCAIHHGRIAYPTDKPEVEETASDEAEEAKAAG